MKVKTFWFNRFVLYQFKLAVTVPVVRCHGALSQPIQTPVQSVLDPVLGAGRVLHGHQSGSEEEQERRLVITQCAKPTHIFCGILSTSSLLWCHVYANTHTCAHARLFPWTPGWVITLDLHGGGSPRQYENKLRGSDDRKTIKGDFSEKRGARRFISVHLYCC